jgi:hypothetical protein
MTLCAGSHHPYQYKTCCVSIRLLQVGCSCCRCQHDLAGRKIKAAAGIGVLGRTKSEPQALTRDCSNGLNGTTERRALPKIRPRFPNSPEASFSAVSPVLPLKFSPKRRFSTKRSFSAEFAMPSRWRPGLSQAAPAPRRRVDGARGISTNRRWPRSWPRALSERSRKCQLRN